jgi:hypothetical protein
MAIMAVARSLRSTGELRISLGKCYGKEIDVLLQKVLL